MKNLHIFCLLFAFSATLMAQELPSIILEQYPELKAFEQERYGGDNDRMLGEYLLSARRTSSWDTYNLTWSLYDSLEYFYNTAGNYKEIIDYNPYDGAWTPNRRKLYFYNDAQQITLFTNQSWVDGQWGQSPWNAQDVYVYDELGNTLEVINQYWVDDEWSTSYKTTNTYYEGTNLQETQLIQGDNDNNELVNISLYIYEEYNSNGDVLRYTFESWDEFSMEWKFKKIIEREYNTDNQLILSVTNQEVNGDIIPESQSIYSYNDEGILQEVMNQNWDNLTQSWIDDIRLRYEYDENGYVSLREYAEYNPFTQQFRILSLYTATYFDHGGIEQYVLQHETEEGLVNDSRVTYTYYEDFFMEKTFIAEFWNPDLNAWENNTFEEYFYTLFIDTKEVALKDDKAVHLFPNPATEQVNIQMNNTLLVGDGIQAQLYNLQGQFVRQYTLGQESHQISVVGLPVGSYWLKVSNGQQFTVKQLIIK